MVSVVVLVSRLLGILAWNSGILLILILMLLMGWKRAVDSVQRVFLARSRRGFRQHVDVLFAGEDLVAEIALPGGKGIGGSVHRRWEGWRVGIEFGVV